MYGETLDSSVSVGNENKNMPDRKIIIFVVNLPLKLFRDTIPNADTGTLESHHTLFAMYLNHMLAKPYRSVQNVRNFEFFDNKIDFLKTILTNR